MAEVVSGIENCEGAPLPAFIAGAGAFVAGAADCTAAVTVVVLRFTRTAIPSAKTATTATSFHRICMKNLTCMGCGLESYRRRANAATGRPGINEYVLSTKVVQQSWGGLCARLLRLHFSLSADDTGRSFCHPKTNYEDDNCSLH